MFHPYEDHTLDVGNHQVFGVVAGEQFSINLVYLIIRYLFLHF